MQATINGKLVNIPRNTTVAELKALRDDIHVRDSVIVENFSGTKSLPDNAIIQANSKLHSVPSIVKGEENNVN